MKFKTNQIAIIVAAALVIIAVGFWYGRNKKPAPVAPTQKSLVPQLPFKTNPLEGKVPEVNPLEKANPFKYTNPLR